MHVSGEKPILKACLGNTHRARIRAEEPAGRSVLAPFSSLLEMEASQKATSASFPNTLSESSVFCDNFVCFFKWLHTCSVSIEVAYPSLRVEREKLEEEELRGFPPGVLRPASIEPLDLQKDGNLCPCGTAKAADLAKLAPQFTIRALQERGGSHEFACHPWQLIVSNCLLKVALERIHRFRNASAPGVGKRC